MLGVNEAHKLLGVSKSHIYNLVSTGAIAHYRFGKRSIRFEEEVLLAYKESCAVAARQRIALEHVEVRRVNVSLRKEKSSLREYFESLGLKVKD